MLQTGTVHVHSEWINNSFSIWCIDDEGHVLAPPKWRNQLFAWHETSFYGTFIEEVEMNGIPKVTLSPWLALDFFANAPENSFMMFELTDVTRLYRTIGSYMFQAIMNSDFMPDFNRWKREGYGWKPSTDWPTSFLKAKQSLDEQLSLDCDELINKWFSIAIEDWIIDEPSLSEAWKEIVEEFPIILREGQDSPIIDEQDWLEKIGWSKDLTPFQLVLQIDEPDHDDEIWILHTMLRDKDNPDDLILFDGFLPDKWRAFEGKVEREYRMWTKLVPWLDDAKGGIINSLTEHQAWDFLTEASEKLLNAGVEILLPSWWQAIKEAQLAVKAKVKTGTGSSRQSFVGLNSIIDFDWRFSTNGVDLSEEEFMSLVEQKRRLINVRGRWIKLDPAFIKQVQYMLSKANKEGLHFRDVLEQELLYEGETGGIDELEDPRAFAKVQIELNRHLKKMVKQLQEVSEIPPVEVPSTFKGSLRAYQQQGVEWLLFLRQFGFGACLADDMGLGKTIQMIAYFLTVKQNGGKCGLIICPTSVLGNWQKEFEKFSPSLRIHLHYGANRLKGEAFHKVAQEADIILTSYGLSHLDFEEISNVDWGTVCLDEAQNIKNAHTKQSRAIRKLKGQHHIALTGTPMENRLTELWSIFDFTNSGYLGSLGHFQRRFVAPIEKDRDTEKIGELQRLIKPFLLRRTKTDQEVALNLPEKQEQKEYCPLTVEQASLYEQLVKDTFEQVEQLSGIQRKGLILKMLSKLKQVCDHPALYLKEQSPKDLIIRSSKMEKLLDLMENIREGNESCLIFTQYIGMGEMMKEALEKKFGEKVMFLNGSMPKVQRDTLISDFQNQKFHILILSLKAGGTGLNLTAANHVIHYDRWWNPAVENQATDRAYRIGQKRFVHVHKLISTGTLEEKIDDMLEKKQSLNDEIIQSENWITELSTNELKDLFVLG
ncbi:DEAD/DEAH box helicase [Bacillus timonensis]|nr:DEAD/DEAH box helicase [Bacillus timonensis]